MTLRLLFTSTFTLIIVFSYSQDSLSVQSPFIYLKNGNYITGRHMAITDPFYKAKNVRLDDHTYKFNQFVFCSDDTGKLYASSPSKLLQNLHYSKGLYVFQKVDRRNIPGTKSFVQPEGQTKTLITYSYSKGLGKLKTFSLSNIKKDMYDSSSAPYILKAVKQNKGSSIALGTTLISAIATFLIPASTPGYITCGTLFVGGVITFISLNRSSGKNTKRAIYRYTGFYFQGAD